MPPSPPPAHGAPLPPPSVAPTPPPGVAPRPAPSDPSPPPADRPTVTADRPSVAADGDDAAARRGRGGRWAGVLGRVGGVAFLLVACVGIASSLRGHGDEITALFTSTRAALLLTAAVLVRALGLPLGLGAWRVLVTGPGTPLPGRAAARIYFLALLGKYVPGPVWGVLAYVHLGRRVGVAGGRMVAAYLLNTVVVVLTSAAVGLLCAVRVFGTGALWFCPALLLAGVLFWRPRLVHRCAALAGRLLRRPTLGEGADDRPLRRSMVLETLCWGVSGLHLWLIAIALGAPAAAAVPVSIGGFALATVAGALTLFTPDGAGTRELVLMAAVSTVLPLPQAGAAVLASRICCTLGELLGSGTALLLSRGALPKSTVSGTA